MMKTRIVLTVAALIVGMSGVVAVAEDSDPAVQRGLETYMRVGCYQCHGTDGQGNEAGPALTPDTLPAVAIAAFIRTRPGRMPVYPKESVSDAEIDDIVAFLKSVPPPPDADSIDILKDLKPGD